MGWQRQAIPDQASWPRHRSWHKSTGIMLLPSSPRLPVDLPALAPEQSGDTGLASHLLPSPVTGSGTDM